ncbi:MAG: aminotransferase class V-fold PLP-dependent enzyme [Erysipelotrichales bacterium]|nr:MAG: aminotransferase class V-fold PLP-dependent enzyme [Erysipelotrichales bacterium]
MAYFDYSATTPCDAEVSKALSEADRNYYANPNSSHALGRETRAFIDACIASMKQRLDLIDAEIIFTGGASESNNLAVKGLAALYPAKKHIITSEIEHSSIISPLTYLMKQGYDIDFVALDEHGRYDLQSLSGLLREDTLMVTLVAVDSETGIRQPVEEAAAVVRNHGIVFHCDATQALGKCAIDLNAFDLSSFSIHKFYGPKGIGGLVRRKGLELIPMTHGGKSLTNARSGTPATSFVAAASKAAELFLPTDEAYRCRGAVQPTTPRRAGRYTEYHLQFERIRHSTYPESQRDRERFRRDGR